MRALVVTAAGTSSRMGGVKKEYLPCGDGTVLSQSVKQFLLFFSFDVVAITFSITGDEQAVRDALSADGELADLLAAVRLIIVPGAESRQASVRQALEAIAASTRDAERIDFVFIHDGARPFVDRATIDAVITAAERYGAAVPMTAPVDTLKEIGADGTIARHLARSSLAAVQTPQGFRFEELLAAHRQAAGDDKTYTDDSEIWGAYAGAVRLVPGNAENKKITFQSDIPKNAKTGKRPENADNGGNNETVENRTAAEYILPMKIGLGYDLHRLVAGRRLLLGGVEIPFEKGEAGHSDGDVLLHAITDALLGAAGMGDIGSFFPPEDEQWKNADSVVLLQTVWEKIRAAGWELGNIDAAVKLERPKFLPYRAAVIQSIARALAVSPETVFVKAKTGERCGAVGRGEAVEAWATCLLMKR